jgi:hypothetical protein
LQDPSEINGDNLNNVRREASRHLRNRKREYLKDRSNELATNSKNKNIRDLLRVFWRVQPFLSMGDVNGCRPSGVREAQSCATISKNWGVLKGAAIFLVRIWGAGGCSHI